jgi:hypothetical protein
MSQSLLGAGLAAYLDCRAAVPEYAPEPLALTMTPDAQRLAGKFGGRSRGWRPNHPASEKRAEFLERDKPLNRVSRSANRKRRRVVQGGASHWSLE